MNERIRRRLELRRSSAASPHRNKTRFDKATRHDWKGLVMSEVMEGLSMEDIVVQREGSSHRTVEELFEVFLMDCADIAQQERFDALLGEFQAYQSEDSGGYEALMFEKMSAVVDDAEAWLSDMGYVVEWNDGYTIFKA